MGKSQDYKRQGPYGVLRLKSKDARATIVQKLAIDFNLTPIIAEAFYQQFSLYFQEHANISLSTGEIERKTNYSESSVKRYLADFLQVATLYRQKFSHNQIRLIAQKSDRLVREYIELYQSRAARDKGQ